MWPPDELWAASVLSPHRLCPQLPLLDPDHPQVMLGRRAGGIAATTHTGTAADSVGPVRENPALPGPDTCTQRRFDRTYTGVGFNPR